MDDDANTPEFDPFEMDWPWPGMHVDAPDPAVEPEVDRGPARDDERARRGGTIDGAAFHERAG